MYYYIGYDENIKKERQEEMIDVLLLVYVCIFISFVHIYFLKLNFL